MHLSLSLEHLVASFELHVTKLAFLLHHLAVAYKLSLEFLQILLLDLASLVSIEPEGFLLHPLVDGQIDIVHWSIAVLAELPQA